MGSHMGNALTMSYGFEMNFSRSAFFFDGTFSRFMFSFHLIGGLCVFLGLHRLCSRGSLRDRDLRASMSFNCSETEVSDGFGTPLCRQILTQAT